MDSLIKRRYSNSSSSSSSLLAKMNSSQTLKKANFNKDNHVKINIITKSKCLSKTDTLLKILSSKADDPLTLTPRNLRSSLRLITSDENTPPLCSTKFTDKGIEIMTKYSSELYKNNIGSIYENFNQKIKDDLNSPSASSRMRAIKALRSSNTDDYLFDVPHDEQHVVENNIPQSLPKLEDVFKKIVVYVEVRTEEDNRSAGIKEVIKKMGANINNNLLKDTTHVVFKDGLLSTYNKAKNWKIPIVSILWIEACKRNLQIIDPKLYPISNLDRYENPELYKKMRRIKSMQPDAADKRNKLKVTKKTEISVKIKPSVRVPRKPKDNLNEIFAEFHEKLIATPETNDDYVPFQSKLLERIKNSPFIRNKNQKEPEDDDFEQSPKTSRTDCELFPLAKKQIEFSLAKNTKAKNVINVSESENLKITRRRHTLAVAKKPKPSVNKIIQNDKKLPKKNIKRQTQIFQHFSVDESTRDININETNNSNVSLEISHINNRPNENSLPVKRRRTVYNVVPMEIAEPYNELLEKNYSEKHEGIDQDTQMMIWNQTPMKTIIEEHNNTLVNETPMKTILEEHKNTVAYSAGSHINKRRSIFDISMDIIDKRLQNMNEASRLETPKIGKIIEEKINQSVNIDSFAPPESIVCSDNNNNISNNNLNLPKKRKLFVPNELIDTMNEEQLIKSNSKSQEISQVNEKKRKKENFEDDITKKIKRRRTIGIHDLYTNKISRRRSSAEFQNEKVNQIIKIPVKSQPTKYIIVTTNMHTEQIDFIKKASEILNFTIQNEVTDQTTHVVSFEPGRTINLLKGLIRGLWILKYDWIIESVNKNQFVEEEPYELRSFSNAVEMCRSERQTFGSNYKMDLFSNLMPMYVSQQCNVPYNNVKELIKLCSGKITDNKQNAKYVIGEYFNVSNNKVCVQPQWILDSITNNKLQKCTKYLIKI